MKKRVFIGSSSEGLKLAEHVKATLESTFDVEIWGNVFSLNQNFLNDLLKASVMFDFAILIGSADDKIISRGKSKMGARDNVIFELGLFLGRFGLNKCAYIYDRNTKQMSDLLGITLARYDSTDLSTLTNAANNVKEFFIKSSVTEINILPSSTLAYVYFENFITPTCKHLISQGGIKVRGVHYKDCKIKVVIPSKINKDVNMQFEKLKLNFKTESIDINSDGRVRRIIINTEIVDDFVQIIDFPTVIAGISFAISHVLPEAFIKQNEEYDEIINRELSRFIAVLSKSVHDQGYDKYVEIIQQDV